jgi:hypothetical protein
LLKRNGTRIKKGQALMNVNAKNNEIDLKRLLETSGTMLK